MDILEPFQNATYHKSYFEHTFVNLVHKGVKMSCYNFTPKEIWSLYVMVRHTTGYQKNAFLYLMLKQYEIL